MTPGWYRFLTTLVASALSVGVPSFAHAEPSMLDPTVTQVSAGSHHSCALTTSGGVKCWGAGGNGELGDGTLAARATPVDVVGLTSGVAAVSAGQFHTCALLVGGAVKCWGNNSYGQLGDGTTTDSPTPIEVAGMSTGAASIAAGGHHTCALTTGGAVKCWGGNFNGQLGDGTTTMRITPITVSGLASGVDRVAVGLFHSCAVILGGARCWGYNIRGQLGDGTTTQRPVPVNVVGVSSSVVGIGAGSGHTCAVTANGGAKCWGANSSGELGDGTTTQRALAVNVSGLSAGLTGISAGGSYTCAQTTVSGLKCWGRNSDGQLGDGTRTQRLMPVEVSGLTAGIAGFSAGGSHACALTGSGGVKCWGYNSGGQLGDGSAGVVRQTTPVDVSGLTSGVDYISAGSNHTCAVTTAGGAKCWGGNAYGQLGDGTIAQRLAAVDVSGLTTGVVSIAEGFRHTCAITTVGGLKCWGWNRDGQLGDGTTADRLTPTDVLGLTSGVTSVSAGTNHTCAVVWGGVKCWGANYFAQLGDGTTTQRSAPQDVVGLATSVSSVSTRTEHTCALTQSGGAKCWGYNGSGRLGDGTTAQRLAPVDVLGLTTGVSAVAAGGSHSCAITTAGRVKCWGDNFYGELGDGTTTTRSVAGDVTDLATGVVDISSGSSHTCAIAAGGSVKCWGSNGDGQLGDGTLTRRTTPVDVAGLMTSVQGPVVRVTAGGTHTCVQTVGGGAKCWGSNYSGQLGGGPIPEWRRTLAVNVSRLSEGVAGLEADGDHTCALSTGRGVRCTGGNAYGQLGDGTTTYRSTWVDVLDLTSGVASIAGGLNHTCAVTMIGGAKCWGRNDSGEMGDASTTDRATPVDVWDLTSGVASLSAGAFHTCALTTAGGVKCWGRNTSGQLGDGTTTDRTTAVAVAGLGSGVAAIGAGGYHTCALMASGGVKCWGANSRGQLGDGTTATFRSSPADMEGLTSDVTKLSTGLEHTCVVTIGGAVKCSGANDEGQLGDGTHSDRNPAVGVSGLASGVADISAGAFHTCALTTGGGAKCWGQNFRGQLGDGTQISQSTPIELSGLPTGVSSVSAGGEHTCAVASLGLMCWGRNLSGELGDETNTQRNTPVNIRKGQSIAFAHPPGLALGVVTSISGAASSGLLVTFDSWTPGTCTVEDHSVVAVAPALCGIRATQIGTANNAPAPQVLRLIAIVPFPSISIADASLVEGNLGWANAIFVVSLSAPSAQTVTVSALTSDLSDAAGSDYTPVGPQTLTFPPMTTSQTLSVPVLGDTLLEGDETFQVTLSSATNVAIADAVGIGTITNDEPPSRVFVAPSGNDANDCSEKSTPCRSLSAAVGQVAIDGEVVVLASGEYDAAPIMISKGVKIESPSGTVAFVRQPITVSTPGGRVVLRGLTLKGAGSGNAVTLAAADSLSIEDTTIDGWSTGLRVTNAVASQVSVLNSVFRANVSGITDNGGAPGNRVSIEESRFEGNLDGIDVRTGAFVLRESVFMGNTVGVTVGPGSVDTRRSAFSLNGTALSAVSGGTIGIARSWIFGNTTGLASAGGGVLNSAGTNVVRGNGTDTMGAITIVPEQ